MQGTVTVCLPAQGRFGSKGKGLPAGQKAQAMSAQQATVLSSPLTILSKSNVMHNNNNNYEWMDGGKNRRVRRHRHGEGVVGREGAQGRKGCWEGAGEAGTVQKEGTGRVGKGIRE